MSPSRAKSKSAGARPSNGRLAPADKLKREIQAVLTGELRSEEHRMRRPFRYTPAGLSRRAQTVVQRVRAQRG